MNIRRTFIILLILSASNSLAGELTWKLVKYNIKHKFPDVSQITVAELASTNRTEYLLIDVRAKDEYKVSHMKDAINLENVNQIAERIKNTKKVKIILYCSVGYRSADIANQLLAKGITNVYNLEGSIFEWVNSGHEIYDGNGKTSKVHPYNKSWGRLLNKKYRH